MTRGTTLTQTRQPQHWLWVVRPAYYAEADGRDLEALEPRENADAGDWWTCDARTRAGDLILMYRTTPKMDVAYLIQAASDARELDAVVRAQYPTWTHSCEFRVLAKLDRPITLAELRAEPRLASWGARRSNFQGQSHTISPDVWAVLEAMVNARLDGAAPASVARHAERGIQEAKSEKALQRRLLENPAALAVHGINVSFFKGEFTCRGIRGRIDLLGQDDHQGSTVVIELKVVRAGRTTFGQICGYVGWLDQQPGTRKPVHGVVIADGFDDHFRLAAQMMTPRIQMIELADVNRALGVERPQVTAVRRTLNRRMRRAPDRRTGRHDRKGELR